MLKKVHCPIANTKADDDKSQSTQKSPEILVEIPSPKYTTSNPKNSTKNEHQPQVLRALLDSGSTGCIILNEFTRGLTTVTGRPEKWTTKGGAFTTRGKCRVPMTLVDFTRSTTVEFDCYVDSTQKSSESNYDLILGKDFQQEFGIDILNSSLTLRWDGIEVPMREFGALRRREPATHRVYATEAAATGELQSRATRILDAHYVKADLTKVVQNQNHLTWEEQVELSLLLHKYEHLFDGTLGVWKGSGVSFELKANAKPYHARPYPIPYVHEMPTKTEVERLCKLGVLAPCTDSEWGAPSFIIAKKNRTVRFLSDFRRLNAMLKRKPFPIPKIQDMLQKLEGFRYATALDLNMGYYTIRLNPDAQRLCTIVLPWGKYKYLRLPMGVSGAPDIFQAKMSSLMAGLDCVRVYLDDCLVLNKTTFQDHLAKLELALKRISDAGLRINAEKSYFGRGAIEYLGYWVTREGIQPLPAKVDAMLSMEEPKTRRQLRAFVGLVNYYRDMWRRRSHVLAPLTALCSDSKKWVWGEEQRKAFTQVKQILSKEAILAFPDFSKEFVIYTDASKYQLGGVITQEGKPLAFYSRKLNDAQTRYTTTERELLSIVETLKEFRNILLGQQIVVYTDHKNLIYNDLQTDRVLRWRLLLEEYGVDIRYITGITNIVADVLSRYPTRNDPTNRKLAPTTEQLSETFAQDSLSASVFPVNFTVLANFQQQDRDLQTLVSTHQNVSRKIFRGGEQLICYKDRIYVPKALQKHVVEWYHTYLMHPGETRLEASIAQHLYWPNIRQLVQQTVKSCPTCQKAKGKRLKYGHLPAQQVAEGSQPWEKLCVDTIGPYQIRRKGKKTLVFKAVTMIDPATGWFEMQQLKTKKADEVANAIETTWLTRYPWPQEITYDAGTEFKAEFQSMISEEYHIKPKPITVRNPQANAVIERIHGVVGDMMRTYKVENINDDDADPFSGIVSAICWAVRSTYHTTLQATPGQLVFGRDMIFNIRHEADWQLIRERKRARTERNNAQENAKRREHDYAEGEKVLINKADYNKMEPSREGPYTITRVHANGTVTIQKGRAEQRINIRQCTPYFEALDEGQ
jgi:transposase InsO family protein